MTCVERLRELYPDWDEDKISCAVGYWCPSDFNILCDPAYCRIGMDNPLACEACWAREANSGATLYERTIYLTASDLHRLNQLVLSSNKRVSDIISEALKLYEDQYLKEGSDEH